MTSKPTRERGGVEVEAVALAAAMLRRIYDRWCVGSELVSELRTAIKFPVKGYIVCGRLQWVRR